MLVGAKMLAIVWLSFGTAVLVGAVGRAIGYLAESQVSQAASAAIPALLVGGITLVMCLLARAEQRPDQASCLDDWVSDHLRPHD